MNEKHDDFTPADMTDVEFDSWLCDANDDIHETLDMIVETEDNLLKLKQQVAQEAIAVAHANGSDGPDRLIREVLDPNSTSVAAQRSALGRPGPRQKRRRIRLIAGTAAVGASLFIVSLGMLAVNYLWLNENDSRSLALAAIVALETAAVLTGLSTALFTRRRLLASLGRDGPNRVEHGTWDPKNGCMHKRVREQEPVGEFMVRSMARVFSTPPVVFLRDEEAAASAQLDTHHPVPLPDAHHDAPSGCLPEIDQESDSELVPAGFMSVHGGSGNGGSTHERRRRRDHHSMRRAPQRPPTAARKDRI